MYKQTRSSVYGCTPLLVLLLQAVLCIYSGRRVQANPVLTVMPDNNRTVAPDTVVTYNCSIQSNWPPRDTIDWSLRFQDGDFKIASRDTNNTTSINFSMTDRSLSVLAKKENNFTIIRCSVIAFGKKFSDPVLFTIAGPPLSPSPTLEIVTSSLIEVKWEKPYSAIDFEITNYTVQVFNDSRWVSDTCLAVNESNSTMSLHFPFDTGTQQFVTSSCHLLTFNVIAMNDIGASPPGNISGGFPIAPGPFPSEINVDVKFHADGSPTITVSFEAPFICDFQTSTYIIFIEEFPASNSNRESPVTRQSSYTGSSRMISETFDSELKPKRNYTVTIVVVDDHFIGNVSTTKMFRTFFSPSQSPDGPSETNKMIFIGPALGVMLALLVLFTAVVIVMCACPKLRPRPPNGVTMDFKINNLTGNNIDGTVRATPDEIMYESIPNEYYMKKILQAEHIDIPEQQQRTEEDSYQVMKSSATNCVPATLSNTDADKLNENTDNMYNSHIATFVDGMVTAVSGHDHDPTFWSERQASHHHNIVPPPPLPSSQGFTFSNVLNDSGGERGSAGRASASFSRTTQLHPSHCSNHDAVRVICTTRQCGNDITRNSPGSSSAERSNDYMLEEDSYTFMAETGTVASQIAETATYRSKGHPPSYPLHHQHAEPNSLPYTEC